MSNSRLTAPPLGFGGMDLLLVGLKFRREFIEFVIIKMVELVLKS